MDPSLPDAAGNTFVDAHRSCAKCGYSIQGLPMAGQCPGCGSPVAESLRGDLLQHAGPEYLRTILKGHSWVLNGVLALIIVQFSSIFVTISGLSTRESTAVLSVAGLAVAVAIFLGYLKLTEPDPQFNGTNRPDGARRVVRISSIVSVMDAAIGAGIYLLAGPTVLTAPSVPVVLILICVQIVGSITTLAQFLGMMNYEMWLGHRVPDAWLVRRAAMYRWLLPLIFILAFVLAGLGPLVALIMYWNLLDRMRKHLKSIVANGKPAELAGIIY